MEDVTPPGEDGPLPAGGVKPVRGALPSVVRPGSRPQTKVPEGTSA